MSTPFLDPADPDWVAFQAGDTSFALKAAGEAIRRFCGWHLYPSVTETLTNVRVGSNGIIDLPSLYVTGVTEVDLFDGPDPTVLDPSQYVWFQYGTIQLYRPQTYPWGYYGGYGFVPGGYLPSPGVRLASVTLTHGYDEVPVEIKQVAFELATASSEIPTGSVKDIQTPGFRLQLGTGAGGGALNPGQMDRLASFKIGFAR